MNKQASKWHLIVGAILVILSMLSVIASFALELRILSFLIFFFGVWGGVELGRYLEHWLSLR